MPEKFVLHVLLERVKPLVVRTQRPDQWRIFAAGHSTIDATRGATTNMSFIDVLVAIRAKAYFGRVCAITGITLSRPLLKPSQNKTKTYSETVSVNGLLSLMMRRVGLTL